MPRHASAPTARETQARSPDGPRRRPARRGPTCVAVRAQEGKARSPRRTPQTPSFGTTRRRTTARPGRSLAGSGPASAASNRAASWHVCVGHDGVLWRRVPFLRGAWHCAKGTIDGHRVNACAIGIELEGHGDSFPEAQVAAAGRVTGALVAAYEIPREQTGRGHREFDPARRSDPGPVWEVLPNLLQRAYQNQ